MRVRRAVAADAKAIAHVHVSSWQTTYRGLLPGEYLASLDERERETMWDGVLAKGAHEVFVLERDGGVVGFASYGPVAGPGRFEVGAIYLLAEHQGRGGGTLLLGAGFDAVHARGGTSLIAWVIAGNPAEAFYRSLGGKPTGAERVEEIGGTSLREVCYEWDRGVLTR